MTVGELIHQLMSFEEDQQVLGFNGYHMLDCVAVSTTFHNGNYVAMLLLARQSEGLQRGGE